MSWPAPSPKSTSDPLAAQRQCQVDQLALQVGRDLERRGRRIELRDRERRAVGQHARSARNADAAEGEQGVVEHQLGQAPGIGRDAAGPCIDQPGNVARLLLKVVRLQEHALRPDHRAAPTHWATTVPETVISSALIVITFFRLGLIVISAFQRARSMSR